MDTSEPVQPPAPVEEAVKHDPDLDRWQHVIDREEIQRLGLSDTEVETLLKLHARREQIVAELRKIPLQPNPALASLARAWSNVLCQIQEVRKSPRDVNLHRWWTLPRCTCPKTENEKRHAVYEFLGVQREKVDYTVNEDCPLHGSFPAAPAPVEAAVKHDAGKLRFDLIPPHALGELARVYTIGAAKYGDHNWKKGMPWGRVVAALLRHLYAWLRGEDHDPQDGQHHLASVMWCAVTLMEYQRRKVGEDDVREPMES